MFAARNRVYVVILVSLGIASQAARGENAPVPTVPLPAAQAAPAAQSPPVDPAAGSFSLGLYFGNQLRASGLQGTLALDQFEKAFREGLAGKLATDADKARMTQMLHDGRAAVAAHNREQARDFLAQNAKVDGVVTTASGLQYAVIKPGDQQGNLPKPTDRVTVHYRGRLLDGTQFDSSDAHAMPATFRLNGGVIKGWQEALSLMKQGAEWRVFVPPDLAYGDGGPTQIPPGSLLVFDLELVRVELPDAMPSSGAKLRPPQSSAAPQPAR